MTRTLFPVLPTPPSSKIKQYDEEFALTGFDQTSSLFMYGLEPWMDSDFLTNFCNYIGQDVQVSFSQEGHAFIQFETNSEAMRFKSYLNIFPIPNSSKVFRLQWVPPKFLKNKPEEGYDWDYLLYHSPNPPCCYVSITYICLQKYGSPKHNPIPVHGTVKVEDKAWIHTLYDQRLSDNDITDLKGGLTLTGPLCGIEGLYSFEIKINLADEEGEFVSGTIMWNIHHEVTLLSYANFDCRLKDTIFGKRGKVTVGYAVVQESFSATIEVILMREGGDLPEKVHGKILAIQDIEGTLPLSLFNKSEDASVPLRNYDNAIPLTRSVVVAPANVFIISATLNDNSGRILNGHAKFHPKFGTTRQIIKTEREPQPKKLRSERQPGAPYELSVSVTFY